MVEKNTVPLIIPRKQCFVCQSAEMVDSPIPFFTIHQPRLHNCQPTITCLKLTIETLEHAVKSVQS